MCGIIREQASRYAFLRRGLAKLVAEYTLRALISTSGSFALSIAIQVSLATALERLITHFRMAMYKASDPLVGHLL